MKRRYQQVDPFNADDPVMPWDELGDEFVPLDAGADWTAPHDTSGSASASAPVGSDAYPTASYPTTDGRDAREQQPGRGSAAGRAEKGRTSEPRSSKARVRATRPQTRVARSQRPAGQGRQQAAAGPKPQRKTSGRVVVRLVRRLFTAAVVFLLLSGPISSVGGCVAGLFGGSAGISEGSTVASGSAGLSFDGPDKRADYDGISDELSSQLSQDLLGRLDAIKQGEDTSYDDTVAKVLDDSFVSYSGGLTLEGAGLDSHELARWLLSQITYDPSSVNSNVYLYTGKLTYEGTASVTVSAPSYYEFSYALVSYLRGAYGNDALGSAVLTDAQKSQLKDQMPSIQQQVPRNDWYLSVDTNASVNEDGSDAWASLDEKSFEENIESLVGIYPEG